MKQSIIFLFILLLVSITQAELTQLQRELVGPHIPKIEQSIHILEQELEKSKDSLAENYQKLEEVRQALRQDPSVWQLGKLKTQETYYEQLVNKGFNDVEKKVVQVTIYHCILFAFHSREISKEQIQADQIFIAKIQAKIKWAKSEHEVARQRWEKAQKRLMEIPQENERIQKRLDELAKQLEVLEYKKSWGNLPERLEIQAKISTEKGKLLKNEGETFVQEEIKQDSWKEMQAMIYEQTEAEIALTVLNNI